MKLKLLLMTVVILCGIWGIREEIVQVQHSYGVALDRRLGDIDEPYLVPGMQAPKTLSDTMRWWSGPWVYGTAYYRPLTSYGLWAQYQIFGDHGFAQFKAVLLAMHLVVLALVFLFLSDLLNVRIAALASVLWGLGATGWLGLMTPWHALQHWKDQPEMMVAIPYLAALWCVLRFSRTENKSWAGAGVLLFIIAVLFKEMAYSLPLVVIALLWREGTAEKQMNLIVTFLLVAAVLFGLRTYFLQGLGEVYGEVGINETYFLRWVRAVCGDYGLAWVRSGWQGCMAVAGTLAVVGLGMKGNRDWCLALLLLALTFLPLTGSVATAHATYLVSIFAALWLAYGIEAIVQVLQRVLTQWGDTRTVPGSAGSSG